MLSGSPSSLASHFSFSQILSRDTRGSSISVSSFYLKWVFIPRVIVHRNLTNDLLGWYYIRRGQTSVFHSPSPRKETFKTATLKLPEIPPLLQKTGPACPELPPLIPARRVAEPPTSRQCKTLTVAILSPAAVSIWCPFTLTNHRVL